MWWISGNYSLTINHFSVTLIKQLMAMNNKLCMNFCGNINKLCMNFCGNIKLVLRIHLALCRYPLTGYQAFSICLASIDSKLCCTIWSIYGDLLQVQPLNSIFCLLIIPLEFKLWNQAFAFYLYLGAWLPVLLLKRPEKWLLLLCLAEAKTARNWLLLFNNRFFIFHLHLIQQNTALQFRYPQDKKLI